MHTFVKRPMAWLCAVIMCLSLLNWVALPRIAETALAVGDTSTQTESIPAIWETLENTTQGGAVVPAADGTTVFVAPDWSVYAYTTADLKTKATLTSGTVFYAKMPTTDIIYKLTYGTNATTLANAGTAETIVAFPGTYADTVTLNPNVATLTILGPKAGIAAGNTTNGTATRTLNDTNEAIFTGTVNFGDNILGNGDAVVIDGIAGTGAVSFNTNSASDTTAAIVSFTFNNCLFTNIKGGTESTVADSLFSLKTIHTTKTVEYNTTKTAFYLNINDCYLKLKDSPDEKTNFGNFISTDQIHIADSVLLAEGSNTPMFYAIPTSGTYNGTEYNTIPHALSFTSDNCYVNAPGGYIYIRNNAFQFVAGERLEGDYALRDNTFIDSAITSQSTSHDGLIVISSAQQTTCAVANLIITGNTITASENVTTASYGQFVHGSGNTGRPMHSVVFENNVISGYGTQEGNHLFTGTYPGEELDISNNVFKNASGQYIAPVLCDKTAFYKMSDIALNDEMTAWATDFNIVSGADAAELSWANDGSEIYAQLTAGATATIEKAIGSSVGSLLRGIQFASNHVTATKVYNADGSAASGKLTDGTTYLLETTHALTGKSVRYTVTVNLVEGSLDIDDTALAGRCYFDETLRADAGDTVTYVMDIDGEATEVLFTVGQNLFGSIEDIPVVNGQRHVYLFTKEYTGRFAVNNDENYLQGATTYIYGAQAGVSGVVDSNSDGIADGKNPARNNLTKETVFVDVEIESDHQNNLIVDGITFAGETKIIDVSGVADGFTDAITVINCVTDEARPLTQTVQSGQIIGAKATARHNVTLSGNHLVMSENSTMGSLVTVRHAQLQVTNNYLKSSATTNVVYSAPGTAAGSTNLEGTYTVNISGNTIVGGVLSLVGNATTSQIPVDITVDNNKLVVSSEARGSIGIGGLTTSGAAAIDPENTSIKITNNDFSVVAGKLAKGFIYIAKTPAGQAAIDMDISGNVFTSTANATVKCAIRNYADYPYDVSDNTFVGFDSTFGNYDDNGLSCIAGTYGQALPVDLAVGESVAAITRTDGTAWDPTVDNSNIFSIIDTPVSGSGVVDNENLTITDLTPSGIYYEFYTRSDMMVRIEKTQNGETTYYYNRVPLDSENTTIKVVLTTADGTAVGDSYTMNIVAAPIGVKINADACKVESETGSYSKPYTTYWEGQIISTNSEDISALLSRVDFKITDYGMFYANTADAVTDEACQSYVATGDDKTVATYTIGGKTVGQKESYANDANGLSNIYLIYSLRMHNVGYNASRYGRMYLTYQFGGNSYTVYSDVVTLTTGSIPNVIG